jgi:hypothetical protein
MGLDRLLINIDIDIDLDLDMGVFTVSYLSML